MQKHVNLKHVALLLGLLLTAVWCGANEIGLKDGFSNINIKEGNVQDYHVLKVTYCFSYSNGSVHR